MKRFKLILPKVFDGVLSEFGYYTVFRMNKKKDVIHERKIRYSEDDPRLYLHICKPKKEIEGKLPISIYIHGGGYMTGRPSHRDAYVSQFASHGHLVINVYYGLSPRYAHPVPIQNIYKALAWVIDNADKYNGDIEKVYLHGDSAGAYFCTALGAISIDSEVKEYFQVDEKSKDMKFAGMFLNCGIYDFEKMLESGFRFIDRYAWAYYQKPLDKLAEDKDSKYLSPVRFINKDFPKCFVITASKDRASVGGYELVEQLKENNVPCEHYEGDGFFGVHAFAVVQAFDITKEAMKRMFAFLET